ncbi:uncharacterized protein BDW43DRAFT_276744, partial [Aspergillus alliaceus]|uniref:uncharacterized protein n=1 Tax=Petromyces alliaceus TaxID=209559 RepID=UPI0012A679A0
IQIPHECDDPIYLDNMYELYLKWQSNETSNVEKERERKEGFYHTGTVGYQLLWDPINSE